MSFNKTQFKTVIEETLKRIDKYSEKVVCLLLGTCAQESDFGTYFYQINGPALGVFQMEPATMRDIWCNYLNYRDNLVRSIYQACGVVDADEFALKTNIAYQIIMARFQYYRVPEPLPTTVHGFARYWKIYYNTHKEKGIEEKFVENYNRYVL